MVEHTFGIGATAEPGAELGAALADIDIARLGPEETLAFLDAEARQRGWAESRRNAALVQWAELHAAVPPEGLPGSPRLIRIGGEGTPRVNEFCFDELAAAQDVTHTTARNQLAAALDLAYRLPRTAAALADGRIPGWRARLVAEATRVLPLLAARRLDQELEPIVAGVGANRLGTLVEKALIEADPEAAQRRAQEVRDARDVEVTRSLDPGVMEMYARTDPADALAFKHACDQVAATLKTLGDADPAGVRRSKALGILADPQHALDLARRAANPTGEHTNEPEALRPVTVYVHLSREQLSGSRGGAATVEGYGPISVGVVRRWLGHGRVTVQPVIDLEHIAPSPNRFARGRLRTAVSLKSPVCPFPGCCRDSRSNQADHTIPWPRGKTAIDNLSPPCTHHHNVKTHGGWQLHQPVNGIYLWMSPLGRVYLIDRAGVTHRLA